MILGIVSWKYIFQPFCPVVSMPGKNLNDMTEQREWKMSWHLLMIDILQHIRLLSTLCWWLTNHVQILSVWKPLKRILYKVIHLTIHWNYPAQGTMELLSLATLFWFRKMLLPKIHFWNSNPVVQSLTHLVVYIFFMTTIPNIRQRKYDCVNYLGYYWVIV